MKVVLRCGEHLLVDDNESAPEWKCTVYILTISNHIDFAHEVKLYLSQKGEWWYHMSIAFT